MNKHTSVRLIRRTTVLWIIATAAIVVLVCGVIVYAGDNKSGIADHVLLAIDDIAVPEEEFQMFLQDEKANVASYFYQKYGAEFSESFWESEYGGEVPIELAKEKALDKLKRIKVEQQLATELNVWSSAHYDDILKQMSKENSMYGADTLSLYQSYMVYHSKALLETKDKYKLAAKAVPEKTLQQYYAAYANEYFTAADDIEALIVGLSTSEQDKLQSIMSNTVPQIVAEIKNGADAASLIASSPYILELQVKRYGKGEGKDENSSEHELQLKEIAYSLEAGDVTDPFQLGSSWYALVSLHRSLGESLDYEDAKVIISDILLEEQFENKVEQAAHEAEVIVSDEQRYQQIAMQ